MLLDHLKKTALRLAFRALGLVGSRGRARARRATPSKDRTDTKSYFKKYEKRGSGPFCPF